MLRGVRPLCYLTIQSQVPIIWDYVKCFPCNGHSPFAPTPSSRQCSYNLYGQLPNSLPKISQKIALACHPERSRRAEKWCREFRDLSSSYSHCIAAYWFLSAVEGYWQYSRFRHRAQQYYRRKKMH